MYARTNLNQHGRSRVCVVFNVTPKENKPKTDSASVVVVAVKSNCSFLVVEELTLQFFSLREAPTGPNTSGALASAK